MAKFPTAEWQAQQLRLTVFPTLNASHRTPDWWQRITGTEPSESTTDRKRNFSLISGEFGGGSLTLNLASERIDWHLTATDEHLDPSIGIGEIGPMIESLDLFSTLAERWLTEEDIPDVSRLAFGAVLLHLEADLTEAYKRLPDYVPIAVEPDWRDFLFQVNVRENLRNSEYGFNYLNRLSRWSVAGQSIGRVTIGAQGISATGIGTPQFVLRLELDINSPAEFTGTIPRPQLVRLYQESIAAVRAIASDGVAHEQYKLQ